jgi:hypothetical protein
VPRYRDYDPSQKADVFILSGAEDLVSGDEPAPDVTRYQPRTEGLFARIEHHHEARNDYWEVRSKDGLISTYGTPCPSGDGPDWRDPAALADPAGPGKVFPWDEANHRLLALVTNLPLLHEARSWYRKHFWIEPVFGDIQGHGFDLQTSGLRHPVRMSRLILAVALVYLWLLFPGVAAVITHIAELVDRTDRRDCSLFTISRKTLNRLLKLDEPIVVSFFPYPLLARFLKLV